MHVYIFRQSRPLPSRQFQSRSTRRRARVKERYTARQSGCALRENYGQFVGYASAGGESQSEKTRSFRERAAAATASIPTPGEARSAVAPATPGPAPHHRADTLYIMPGKLPAQITYLRSQPAYMQISELLCSEKGGVHYARREFREARSWRVQSMSRKPFPYREQRRFFLFLYYSEKWCGFSAIYRRFA